MDITIVIGLGIVVIFSIMSNNNSILPSITFLTEKGDNPMHFFFLR